MLRRYFKSFYLNRTVAAAFGMDLLAVSLISLSVFLFNKLLEWRLYLLTGGKDLETFQATLLSTSTNAAQQFFHGSRMFALIFFSGVVFLILFALLVSALSQQTNWSILSKKKIAYSRQTTFRWFKLFFAFILFTFGAAAAYAVLRLAFNLFLPNNAVTAAILIDLFNSLCLLIFLVWSLLVLSRFTEKEKIWESIGASFSWLAQNKKKFAGIIFYALITFIIVNLLYQRVMPLRFMLTASTFTLFATKLIVFLGYYNWLRWYVVKEIKRDGS